jgi:hypothetical protein
VKSTAKPAAAEEMKPLNPVVEAPKKALRAETAPPPADDSQVLRAQPVAPGDRDEPSTDEALRAEPVLRAQPVDPRESTRTRRPVTSRDPNAEPSDDGEGD